MREGGGGNLEESQSTNQSPSALAEKKLQVCHYKTFLAVAKKRTLSQLIKNYS